MMEGRIRKTTTTNLATFSPFLPRPSHRLCTPSTCTSNKTSTVDETLVFNFTNSQHDVAKVLKSAYDACNDVITLFTLIHVRDHYPPHTPFLPLHAQCPQEVLALARLRNRVGIQPKPHFFQEAQLLASTLRGHNYVAPNWRRLQLYVCLPLLPPLTPSTMRSSLPNRAVVAAPPCPWFVSKPNLGLRFLSNCQRKEFVTLGLGPIESLSTPQVSYSFYFGPT